MSGWLDGYVCLAVCLYGLYVCMLAGYKQNCGILRKGTGRGDKDDDDGGERAELCVRTGVSGVS